MWVEGRPKPAEQSQMDLALFYAVDPEYLRVMRIPAAARALHLDAGHREESLRGRDRRDFAAKAFWQRRSDWAAHQPRTADDEMRDRRRRRPREALGPRRRRDGEGAFADVPRVPRASRQRDGPGVRTASTTSRARQRRSGTAWCRLSRPQSTRSAATWCWTANRACWM